jgi:hypothetical protein
MLSFILSIFIFLGCIFPSFPAKSSVVREPKMVSVKNDEFNKSLYSFASKILGLESEMFSIKEYKADSDMAEMGLESHIYFILNKKEEALGVIKMVDYTNDPLTYLHEKSMLKQFEKLSLKKFQTPKILGDAIISDGNGEKGLILETVAPGKSLNNLLREYSRTTNIEEKRNIEAKLKRGFELSGTGLAEIHKLHIKKSPSENYKKRFKRTEKDLGITIAKELPGPFGMIHGDTHLGNIFYDTKTDKTTFIDVPGSEESLKGAPVAYDLAEFLLTFEVLGLYYNLTENELTILSDAFLDSYRKTGPEVSDEAINIYYTYLLAEYGLDDSICSPEQKDQCQFFANYTSKKLAELKMKKTN